MPNQFRRRPYVRPPEPRPETASARGASPARVLVVIAAVILSAAAVAGVVSGGLGGPTSPAASVTPVAIASFESATPAETAKATATLPATPPSPPAESPIATPAPTATPVDAGVPAERLQARLDRLRQKLSIPGISVAILWDDGRQWLGVAGRSDVAGRVRVTPDSGFALASISKTFTAAVVLQLVEEGRLTLDEPVAPHLPGFRLDQRITVRMLLDHSSGLPDFFFRKGIDAALQSAPDARWSAERTWAYVKRKRPVPGTTWAYSNTNYLLLGELVQSVTGRALAVEIRERLLEPLGLEHTWYQVVERPRTSITVGYRLVPRTGGGVRAVPVARASRVMPFRSVVSAAGGAGSVAATALDTARWMQALAGGKVLSPSMTRAMIDDAAATTALRARIPYGLGVQVTTIGGRMAIGHSGRYLGFRNVVRRLPAEGLTIAVLTNQGVADPARVVASLLNVVAPRPEATPSPAPAG